MIEDAWRLLNATNEWVRFADGKAAGSLAGAGVLAGALAQAGLSSHFDDASQLVVGLWVVSGGFAPLSAVLALYALTPTLRVGEPTSLIYFEHVARRYSDDATGHAAAVRALLQDPEMYLDEVAAQVWANSKVARGKFLASGWALFALGLGLLLAGAASVTALAG